MGRGYPEDVIFSHADGHDADQMLDKASHGMIELTHFSAVQLELVNNSVHENATAFVKTQAVSVSNQRSIFMVPLVSEEVQVPLVDVSWDEMSTDPIVQGVWQQLIQGTEKDVQSDIHMHEGLLKQLAQGEDCFVVGEDLSGNERKLTAEFSQHDGWLNQLASGIYDIDGKIANKIVNIRTDGRSFSPGNKEAICQDVFHHVDVKELCLIILVLIRPWDPGITPATAWRQAVFRGGGNVTTQRWAQEEPKLSS
jgi:hypothetical protein